MGPQISMIGFSGHGVIRRSEFGLDELLPTAAGATDGVADQVNVQIEAEFTRPIEGAPTTRQPAEPVN
jgi:polyisoprenoid-binding protein YceI